jgi:hypothetical protein
LRNHTPIIQGFASWLSLGLEKTGSTCWVIGTYQLEQRFGERWELYKLVKRHDLNTHNEYLEFEPYSSFHRLLDALKAIEDDLTYKVREEDDARVLALLSATPTRMR